MAIQPSGFAPGEKEVSKAPDDALNLIGRSVDDVLDGVLGIRPVRHIGRPLTTLAPANAFSTITGLRKPSEIVEEFEDRIQQNLQSGRGLRPPRF